MVGEVRAAHRSQHPNPWDLQLQIKVAEGIIVANQLILEPRDCRLCPVSSEGL